MSEKEKVRTEKEIGDRDLLREEKGREGRGWENPWEGEKQGQSPRSSTSSNVDWNLFVTRKREALQLVRV